MRPIENNFFVTANYADTYKVKGTSLDLIIDPDFVGSTEADHAVQHGIIKYCPMRITKRSKYFDRFGRPEWKGFHYDVELFPGDKIYFHHFVVNKDNEYDWTGEKLYLCHYQNIYCVVREGKVIMLEDWIFFDQIKEDESNYQKPIDTPTGKIILLTKPTAEVLPEIALIKHSSNYCRSIGLKEGVKVKTIKDADYRMLLEDKPIFRMNANMVYAIL